MENPDKSKVEKMEAWFEKWKKFDTKTYLNDFQLSSFYWLLAALSFFILFEVHIKNFINSTLIEALKACPISKIADLMFLLFSLLSFGALVNKLRKHLLPTINSILFGILILILYKYFFKQDDTYTFYHFTNLPLNKFTYLSSVIFSSLLLGFTYKSFFKPLSKKASQLSLIEDNPSTVKYLDVYNRQGYASTIANHVNSTTSEVSFAIGIVGDWGSGKSDFMMRLKQVMKDSDENIVFDFNPWRVNKTDGIIDEFFKTFSKSLQPYNQSITKTFFDYSSRVLKSARETQFKFIDALVNSWFPEEDIQKKYEIINNAVKSTSKRVVIFIDDVDRLTGKEVMEVLRIIRNTANFANTFFIVAIDQSYIVNVLKNTKAFANEEEYLKKVFQLDITLPAFKKEVFIGEIKKHLFTGDLHESYQTEISSGLSRFAFQPLNNELDTFLFSFNQEFLLEQLIDTIRDLKRFCNSFKIVYNLLQGEADIHDLIILELIRNKNIRIYNSIRSKEILVLDPDSSSKLIINTEKWGKVNNTLSEKDKEVFTNALAYLFTDVEYKNQRKLLLSHNFYIYFSYQLFNELSFQEFNLILEKDIDAIEALFRKWIGEEKGKELLKVISNLDDFKDVNSFKNLNIALLRIGDWNTEWFEHVKRFIVIYWQHNHKKYFSSDKEKHKQFLLSILQDNTIALFTRASLANTFLAGFQQNTFNTANFFITREELSETILKLFDEYLKTSPKDGKETMRFYYLNDYEVHDNIVHFSEKAANRFKEFLLINDAGFEEYTEGLIRPYYIPYDGTFVLEPFLEEIFDNWKDYKTKLAGTNFISEKTKRIKSIILKNIDHFYSSNKAPFEIKDDSDRQFIETLFSLKKRNF